MSIVNQLHSNDVLTEVLSTLSLKGNIFCCSDLSAPWAMDLPKTDFAHFHVLERGSAWLKLKNSNQTIALASGDLVIVTYGEGHIISDSPETPPVALDQILQQRRSSCNVIEYGGNGIKSRLICGSFQFDRSTLSPLLAILPPLIHIQSNQGQMADWLESTLKMLAYEARNLKPGSQTILSRLIDIIFVQALRAWLEEQTELAGGWLGALRDSQIGTSISLIHQDPGQNWSVATLANQVGMSRSLFAARFTTLVGEPPLAYLTRWRMHLAATTLAKEKATMTTVANSVGYESEAAFSKAFKRYFGISPSSYRHKK